MLHRAVIVTRPTRYARLLETHGTHGQARWFLKERGQDIAPLVVADSRMKTAAKQVGEQIPSSWRQARIRREDLDRFLFEPEDIVLVVGQDGLVANVARFLDRQVVVGINPDPSSVQGVLVQHAPEHTGHCLSLAGSAKTSIAERTMVEARTDDGQVLRALNEVFLGHMSHQSARYRIRQGDTEERQSSSGLIVATGTGATGWARSVAQQRIRASFLPKPATPDLAWFVREAWPSPHTGSRLISGRLTPGEKLHLVSEQDEGGVIFGDGIEADRIQLRWGQTIEIGCSDRSLRLLEAA